MFSKFSLRGLLSFETKAKLHCERGHNTQQQFTLLLLLLLLLLLFIESAGCWHIMSFQDVGKPGAPKRPQRSHLTSQQQQPASISEGRPSNSSLSSKTGGNPFAQLSDGILQYQVCYAMLYYAMLCYTISSWLFHAISCMSDFFDCIIS